jgi:hypothetical protein
LRQRGIPFVVYTGHPPMLLAGERPNMPVISKPAGQGEIVSALVRVLR